MIRPNILYRFRIYSETMSPQTEELVHPKASTSIAQLKLNSVALVRKRIIGTERLSLVGEVSANFCG
jgi:hypothetical protein